VAVCFRVILAQDDDVIVAMVIHLMALFSCRVKRGRTRSRNCYHWRIQTSVWAYSQSLSATQNIFVWDQLTTWFAPMKYS